MEGLTEKQQHTLDFIRAYIRKNSISPTVQEVALGMGWNSANSASEHILALERKGYLKRIKRASRGIVITQPTIHQYDSLALDAATRIMAIMRTAVLNKEYWPDVRIKAAIQVEVINALQSGGMR